MIFPVKAPNVRAFAYALATLALCLTACSKNGPAQPAAPLTGATGPVKAVRLELGQSFDRIQQASTLPLLGHANYLVAVDAITAINPVRFTYLRARCSVTFPPAMLFSIGFWNGHAVTAGLAPQLATVSQNEAVRLAGTMRERFRSAGWSEGGAWTVAQAVQRFDDPATDADMTIDIARLTCADDRATLSIQRARKRGLDRSVNEFVTSDDYFVFVGIENVAFFQKYTAENEMLGGGNPNYRRIATAKFPK